MVSEPWIAAADLCQLAVPFISLSAYLPQWLKLYRTRSSANISLGSWCGWTVSASFGLFYAFVQQARFGAGWALVVSALLSLVFILLTILLILKYRTRRSGSATVS